MDVIILSTRARPAGLVVSQVNTFLNEMFKQGSALLVLYHEICFFVLLYISLSNRYDNKANVHLKAF